MDWFGSRERKGCPLTGTQLGVVRISETVTTTGVQTPTELRGQSQHAHPNPVPAVVGAAPAERVLRGSGSGVPYEPEPRQGALPRGEVHGLHRPGLLEVAAQGALAYEDAAGTRGQRGFPPIPTPGGVGFLVEPTTLPSKS